MKARRSNTHTQQTAMLYTLYQLVHHDVICWQTEEKQHKHKHIHLFMQVEFETHFVCVCVCLCVHMEIYLHTLPLIYSLSLLFFLFTSIVCFFSPTTLQRKICEHQQQPSRL